jgi:hypothetical protein
MGCILYYWSGHGWGIPNQKSIIVGILIFIYYNFSSIVSISNYENINRNIELKWVSDHLTELLFLITGLTIVLVLLYLKNIEFFHFSELIYLLIYGLGYFIIKKIPLVKNFYIGFVWVWVLHLWSPDCWNQYDYILTIYLSIISYFYDKCQHLHCKFLLDSSILFPYLFLFYIIQEVMKILNLL